MSDLTLYHALFSTCSQKVRFALSVKKLQYESRLVDLSKGEHLEDWYLSINPNGVVPALRHGSAHIIDSSVICEYLDECFTGVSTSPTDPVQRASMRAWMRYFEEVPTAAIRAPSFNKVFLRNILERGEEENRRQRDKMSLRRHFYAKMTASGFAPEVIDESIERLESCLARVERAISAAGPFILGERLSIADIVLLPTVVRMEDLGMTTLWDKKPGVARWYERMQLEPAFAAAYVPGARVVAFDSVTSHG